MSYVLGIDTSCYTTSVAIMNMDGGLEADERKMLQVKEGGRGLRQSEMVFAHTKNLPELLENAVRNIEPGKRQFKAIGVSERPRSQPDSYMPAFVVGQSFARAISAANNLAKVYSLSHQENHIFAGMWSSGFLKNEKDFLAVHLSGGTTEIVRVIRNLKRTSEIKDKNLELELIGSSSDIHAGQFIDRIGVRLGLSFPCGAELEKLAASGHDNPAKIPVAANGLTVSFAGPETFAARLIDNIKDGEYKYIAAGIEVSIAESLKQLLENAASLTGITDILLVGGVASNQFIRKYLIDNLPEVKLYLPSPKYSPDNAVGAAWFALNLK